MAGIDAITGKTLDGLAHVKQSVVKILTTRVGTRVMRREFGSTVPDAVDRPSDLDMLRIEIFAAAAAALARWEPRIRVLRMGLTRPSPGRVEFSIQAVYVPNGRAITLEGIVL